MKSNSSPLKHSSFQIRASSVSPKERPGHDPTMLFFFPKLIFIYFPHMESLKYNEINYALAQYIFFIPPGGIRSESGSWTPNVANKFGEGSYTHSRFQMSHLQQLLKTHWVKSWQNAEIHFMDSQLKANLEVSAGLSDGERSYSMCGLKPCQLSWF